MITACGLTDEGERVPPLGYDMPTVVVEEESVVDGHQEELVPIGWLRVSDTGLIAVSQPMDRGVVIFRDDGTRKTFVGGEGEGPGEFRRPVRGGWTGDTLWVADSQPSRINVFASEGHLVRTIPAVGEVRGEAAAEEGGREYLRPTPRWLYKGDTVLIAGQPASDQYRIVDFARVSPGSAIGQVVATKPLSENTHLTVTQDGQFVARVSVPFQVRAPDAVSPNGKRIGWVRVKGLEEDVARLQVTAVDAWGDVVVDRDISFVPTSIPRDVVDAAVDRRADRMLHPLAAEEMRRRGSDHVPGAYPPVQSVVIDGELRMWIKLREREKEVTWLALDRKGSPLGRLDLPANQHIYGGRGQQLWAVEIDDLGVPHILRLRITDFDE